MAGIRNEVYCLLSWKMIPYSRPKLSDFYALFPTKLLVKLIHRDGCGERCVRGQWNQRLQLRAMRNA